jgi:hypothetical protein
MILYDNAPFSTAIPDLFIPSQAEARHLRRPRGLAVLPAPHRPPVAALLTPETWVS